MFKMFKLKLNLKLMVLKRNLINQGIKLKLAALFSKHLKQLEYKLNKPGKILIQLDDLIPDVLSQQSFVKFQWLTIYNKTVMSLKTISYQNYARQKMRSIEDYCKPHRKIQRPSKAASTKNKSSRIYGNSISLSQQNIKQNPFHCRRRQLSVLDQQKMQLYKLSNIPDNNNNEQKNSFTDRKSLEQRTYRRVTERKLPQDVNKQKTIQDNLEDKAGIIKGCIEQLQGILKDITQNKNRPTSRKIKKSNPNVILKKVVSSSIVLKHEQLKKSQGKKQKLNDFQSIKVDAFDEYIQKIRIKKKEGNNKAKLLSIRQSQQTIDIKPQQIKKKGQRNCKTIEQCDSIDCSSIDKKNQSSFLSQIGKNLLNFDQTKIQDQAQKQTIKVSQLADKKTNRKKTCFLKRKAHLPTDFF